MAIDLERYDINGNIKPERCDLCNRPGVHKDRMCLSCWNESQDNGLKD